MTGNVTEITELNDVSESDGPYRQKTVTVNAENTSRSHEGLKPQEDQLIIEKETTAKESEGASTIRDYKESFAKEHGVDEYSIHEAEENEILDDDFPQFGFEEIEELSEEITESGSCMNDTSVSVSRPPPSKQPVVVAEQIDREKLIKAIRKAYAIRHKERRKNRLLNKMMVEYFRRKKSKRTLRADNPHFVLEQINNYRNLLLKLNKIKGQKEELKKESEQRLKELRKKEQSLKEETTKNIDELNKMLRDIGITCQSTKTGHLLQEKEVEKYIGKMNSLREQISEVRIKLLKSQDKVTALLLKTRQLEDLGDGLTIINFEQLMAENQSLSDKIKERNNKLSKLRRQCSSDTQELAHIREKQALLSSTILVQESVVRDLKNKESSCLDYLTYVKLKYDEMRKKLKEISLNCGLLDKPDLLRDYDRTMEKIEAVEKEAAELHAEKNKLLEQLKIATPYTESKMALKTDMQDFDEALNQELANLEKLPYPRIYQGIKPARNIDLSRYRADWRN